LFLTLRLLYWLFMGHHNGWLDSEFILFLDHLSGAVFNAVFVWLLYVALEPFVRKRWPQRIISWSRLLAGSYRDPLVGRDVLIGAVFGVGVILCNLLTSLGMYLIGRPVLTLNPGTFLIGKHLFVQKFLSQLTAGIFLPFTLLLLLLLFVMIMRRERLGFLLLWLLLTVVTALLGRTAVEMIFFNALAAFFVLFVLYRYGLLATVSTLFFAHLWVFYSVTTEITAWYATDFLIALAICVALVAFGFYISLAGRPLFAQKLLED